MVAQQGEAFLDELEQEATKGGEEARPLYKGLVYRRMLERIGDQQTRQLAYPGLVLRYVTPDLILHVLAPVLKLAMTPADAEVAFTRLARYSWICNRESAWQIAHRRELRRKMLDAMRAEKNPLARQISQAAITYFTTQESLQHDPRAQAEALYHQLLWLEKPNDGANLDLDQLRAAASYIGEGRLDLLKPAQVLLTYAQKNRVSTDLIGQLPTKYTLRAYHRTGHRLINDREYGKAVALCLERAQASEGCFSTDPHEPWEVDALLATAHWTDLWQLIRADAAARSARGNEELLSTYQYADSLSRGNWPEAPLLNTDELVAELRRARSGRFAQEQQQYIKRLMMHGLLRWYRLDAGKPAPAYVPAIFDTVGTLPKLLNSAHFTRKLLYLELLLPGTALSLTLAPSLLKIDPAWLEDLMTAPWMKQQPGEAGKLLRQRIYDARAILTTKTVRQTLDALDVLYRDRFDAQIQGDVPAFFASGTDLLRWFRGPDSEFRDPVRYALLDAFQTPADYRVLARLLDKSLTLRFPDFNPARFAIEIQPDPEHYLEPYIELVDRSWSLGTLLKKATAARPNAEKLARVRDAYSRWDAAVTAAFTQFSP